MKNLALIPARGGSKRIPHKNVRPFFGRPIIEYSIETARDSGLFEAIVVSTDDPKIAEVATAAGAAVPFTRPRELSDDHAPTASAVLHALTELANAGRAFDNVCVLFATAPFVRPEDLARGLSELTETGAPCALAVTDFGFPIFRALRLGDDGSLSMFWPEHETTRSNDLPRAFHDAGQFVWIRARVIEAEKRFYLPGMRAVVLPRHRVQDIDTEEDWTRAEKLYAALASSAPPALRASRSPTGDGGSAASELKPRR